MNESAITIENLTKKFEDKTAVENLNLQVAKENSSDFLDQTEQAKQPQ